MFPNISRSLEIIPKYQDRKGSHMKIKSQFYELETVQVDNPQEQILHIIMKISMKNLTNHNSKSTHDKFNQKMEIYI